MPVWVTVTWRVDQAFAPVTTVTTGATTGLPDAPATDAPNQERVLLLMDGHSLAYRAFYALPPENFSTTTGQTTNAVYGFTSMLINVLRDEQPTHVAVAFDVSRQTFRAERYAEYKATRQRMPDSSSIFLRFFGSS